MFAAVTTLAARLAPVVIRAATHPRTLQALSTTAIVSGANIALRTAKLQGQDKVAQRLAESIQRDRDPIAFAENPQRISTVRQRVVRNAVTLGSATATEVRAYRLVITPPVHLVCSIGVKTAARKVRRITDQLKPLDSSVLDEPSPEVLKTSAKLVKALNRLEKRQRRLLNVRDWYAIERVTPGEIYLADQITTLHNAAITNEVRADTVEQVYIRLLDEYVPDIDLDDLKAAGKTVAAVVSEHFKGDEIGIIRSRVLKPWLTRRTTTLNNPQWSKFIQGWSDATRAVHA